MKQKIIQRKREDIKLFSQGSMSILARYSFDFCACKNRHWENRGCAFVDIDMMTSPVAKISLREEHQFQASQDFDI